MHLEGVEAVLQGVLGPDGEDGQLPRACGGHESTSEPVCDRRPEDEPARLGADDDVDLPRLGPLGHLVDRLVQGLGVRQEGHDVLEDDPGTGEVRDVADLRAEVDAGHRAAMLTGSAAGVDNTETCTTRYERATGSTARTARAES